MLLSFICKNRCHLTHDPSRWPSFHDFRMVCHILVYLFNKVCIF